MPSFNSVPPFYGGWLMPENSVLFRQAGCFCKSPLHNSLEGFFHPLLNTGRVSLAVQDHADIGFSYSEFFRQIIIGHTLVVHFADQMAGPFFYHQYHPFLCLVCRWLLNLPNANRKFFAANGGLVSCKSSQSVLLCRCEKHIALTRRATLGVWFCVVNFRN